MKSSHVYVPHKTENYNHTPSACKFLLLQSEDELKCPVNF